MHYTILTFYPTIERNIHPDHIKKIYIIIKFEMGGLCDRIHSEVTPNIGENV